MDIESNKDTDQFSRHRTHRSGRSRSSRHSRLKIWALSFALLVTVAILIVSLAYSSSRIEELSRGADVMQAQLIAKEKQVNDMNSRLTQSKTELEELIKGRLPTVIKLVPDQVIAVNSDSIKNIVFSVVNHDGSRQYEYKLVVENRSRNIIVPKFRLLIFDKSGVQIGVDQVVSSEELAPGESRSYSSRVDFFMKEDPAYFYISAKIPVGAERMQSRLTK